MKKSVIIGMVIVLAMLAFIDVYLLTANINACTIHEPINLIAVFASGIPLIAGRFSQDVPAWVILICANALSLCIYGPIVVGGAACVRWWRKKNRISNHHIRDADKPRS